MTVEQCEDKPATDSTATIGELDILPPTPETSSLSHETSPPKSIIRDLYIISPVQVKWTPNNPISSAGPSPFLEVLPSHLIPSTQAQAQAQVFKHNPFTITYPDIPSQCSNSLSHFCSATPVRTSHLSHSHSSASTSLKKKVTKQECEHLAKRLRKAVLRLESVYFDPNTMTLIPKSKLEHFIIQQRLKPGTSNTLNESLISQHAPNVPASFNGQSPIFPASFAPSYSDSMVEEAGLIMPPTSP